jgi:hypothetical protein
MSRAFRRLVWILLVLDDVKPLLAEASDVVEHRLQRFGTMGFPGLQFINDAHRVASSVRLGDVAGELLVGDIGVVFKRAGGFNDLDPTSLRALRQRYREFSRPNGRFDQRSEVHMVRRTTFVIVRQMARNDHIVDLKSRLGPVEEGPVDVLVAFEGHRDEVRVG